MWPTVRKLGRHAADPREVRVVEHPRLLDVLAGVDHRARRRAHAGVDPVVHERRAMLHQPLMRRQAVADGKLARPEEALLVREDEKDVIRTRSARSTATGLNRVGRGRSLAVYSIAHAKAQCRNSQAGSEQKAAPRDSRV